MSAADQSLRSEFAESFHSAQCLVSVVVPVYGVEAYLARCLDSLIGQSYSNVEIILVDDGSPDACGEMCDSYALRDRRIRVIHQTNSGVSVARNTGLDVATGDLLMFVDADDWLEPELVAHLVRLLELHDADIAAGGFRRTRMTDQPTARPLGPPQVFDAREALELYAGSLSDAMTAPWGKVYRTSLFDGIRFPEGRFYEDEFVTYRLVSRVRRLVRTDAQLYNYFVREDSATQRVQAPQQLLDRAAALRERGDFLHGLGLNQAAAVSYRKAFLLLRFVGREAAKGGTRLPREITQSLRESAQEVIRSGSPLNFKMFAFAYATFPRSTDRLVALARRMAVASPTAVSRHPGVAGVVASGAARVSQQSAPSERALEVIVVAYGGPEMLRRALEPVSGFPVTVVDNSSMPEIADVCRTLGCTYIDAGRNGGFAAGVNIGLSHRHFAHSDVLLLNPDAVITSEGVSKLHAALLEGPALASVGPVQVDGTGRTARVSWSFPTPLRTWAEAMGLRLPVADSRAYVIGSVLLLRAEAILEVGKFDEGFFLYAEEADWAYRAHQLGWCHLVVQDVQALHLGGATSSDAARRAAHFHGSQERYMRKHHGVLGWQSARIGQMVGDGARAVVKRGEARRAAVRRASLYARGPRAVEATFRVDAMRDRHDSPGGKGEGER